MITVTDENKGSIPFGVSLLAWSNGRAQVYETCLWWFESTREYFYGTSKLDGNNRLGRTGFHVETRYAASIQAGNR